MRKKTAVVAGEERPFALRSIWRERRCDNGTVHFGSWQIGRFASKGLRQFGSAPAVSPSLIWKFTCAMVPNEMRAVRPTLIKLDPEANLQTGISAHSTRQ